MAAVLQQSRVWPSRRFLSEQRRHYYVTPTSYLELLHSYQSLLKRRQTEVSGAKHRYEVGLDKLAATESSVAAMQVCMHVCMSVTPRSGLVSPFAMPEHPHLCCKVHVHAVRASPLSFQQGDTFMLERW